MIGILITGKLIKYCFGRTSCEDIVNVDDQISVDRNIRIDVSRMSEDTWIIVKRFKS